MDISAFSYISLHMNFSEQRHMNKKQKTNKEQQQQQQLITDITEENTKQTIK